MTMTAREISAVLGPVDELLVSEILATGATPEELEQAFFWVSSDEALINQGRPLPAGRIAELVDLLAPDRDDPDE